MAFDLPILGALLSGLALCALGLTLVPARAARGPAVLFAAFAVAWGAQVVVASVLRATDLLLLARLNVALGLAVYVLLAAFATAYPRRFPAPWGDLVRGAFVALAGAGALVFVLDPDLLVAGFGATSLGAFIRPGPAKLPLHDVPFLAAFLLAAVRLLLAYLGAAPGTPRAQVRLVAAGFLMYVAYASAFNLRPLLLAADVARVYGDVTTAIYAALFLAGVGLAGAAGTWFLLRPGPGGMDRFLAASALAPLAAAGLEALVPAAGGPGFDTLGLWRMGMVALIAYAVARYHLFDLEVRLRGLAERGLAPLAAGLAGGLVLAGLAGQGLALAGAGAVAAAGLAGAAAWPARRSLARWMFPAALDDPDYLYHRKVEVYRAAMVRAAEEGPAGAARLEALRRDLALTDREHRLLAALAPRGPAAAAGSPVEGAVVAGRYRLGRVLGEGSHGRALLAYDERADREVVVKVVGSAALGTRGAARLAREARALRAVQHPNVIGLVDVVEGPREVMVVMEYAPGGTLATELQARGRLGQAEAVALLDQVLAGLDAVHAAGLVHRDLKPENLLFGADGAVRIADFGVARDARAGLVATDGGGTLLYMSPEQVQGRAADARSDLYAAGVLFHLALTGKHYLRVAGADDFEIRRRILRAAPRLALSGQPPWVGPFLQRALAKDPARRFPGAAEMRAALPRAGRGGPAKRSSPARPISG